MSDEGGTGPSPFKYHLELTPAQLKLTHTALHALLDDFGHEDHQVHEIIRQVLDKLPDEHAIRAIRLDEEIERGISERPTRADPPPALGAADPDDPPDTVA